LAADADECFPALVMHRPPVLPPPARFGKAEALGALILPVEPGTKLAGDCAWEEIRHDAEHAVGDSGGADRKGERKLRHRLVPLILSEKIHKI
jgi:hypothetical protein